MVVISIAVIFAVIASMLTWYFCFHKISHLEESYKFPLKPTKVEDVRRSGCRIALDPQSDCKDEAFQNAFMIQVVNNTLLTTPQAKIQKAELIFLEFGIPGDKKKSGCWLCRIDINFYSSSINCFYS